MKSAKRILLGSINPISGQLDTIQATQSLLTHRNTPLQSTGMSSAVTLFGYPLRDHLPRYNRTLRAEWRQISNVREVALGKRQLRPQTTQTRELHRLDIGDSIQIQNQNGNRPNRWHNTGLIVEVLPHRQYRVLVDGSRRVTLRNRRFLRKIYPVCRRREVDLAPRVEQPKVNRVITNQPQTESGPDKYTITPFRGQARVDQSQPKGFAQISTPPRPKPTTDINIIDMTEQVESPPPPRRPDIHNILISEDNSGRPSSERKSDAGNENEGDAERVIPVRRSGRTRRKPERLDL